jgi:hypothetical protein
LLGGRVQEQIFKHPRSVQDYIRKLAHDIIGARSN